MGTVKLQRNFRFRMNSHMLPLSKAAICDYLATGVLTSKLCHAGAFSAIPRRWNSLLSSAIPRASLSSLLHVEAMPTVLQAAQAADVQENMEPGLGS